MQQLFAQWRLPWLKSSTEHLRSENNFVSLDSDNPCKRNTWIFVIGISYKLGQNDCQSFIFMLYVHCLNHHWLWKEDALIWSTPSILYKFLKSLQYEKTWQWSRVLLAVGRGKSQVEVSHKKPFDSRVSSWLSSCCWSFITTGEWPLHTAALENKPRIVPLCL